jgi:serine/threonine-protein kinase
VRALTRALQGDLDNIVLKALNKRPQDRYATVDLFAQDIGRHLQGEAILAQRGSTWYYADKFLRRHKLAVASAAVALLALIGGTTLALWQAHAARLEAARAEQVKSFALAMLDSADIDSGAGKATTAVDLLQAARKRVETELAGRPAIAAELMTAIGYGLIGQDRSEDAAALLDKAVRLSSQANGPDDARTIAAQVMYGEALYNLGRNDEAMTLLKSSAERAHRVKARHPEIDALRWLSSAQINAGDTDAAIASARAAVAALPRTPPGNRAGLRDEMQAHQSLANALSAAGKPGVVAEAQTALALARQMEAGHPSPPSVAVRVLLGQGMLREGQAVAGLRELKSAYEEARVLLGDDHAQTEIIAYILASACLASGDVRCAVAAYQSSFDSVLQHSTARGPYAVAMSHYGLAAALASARDDAQALPHLVAAARLFAEAGGPNAPLALRSRSAAAFSLARLGRLGEADRSFASLEGVTFAGADGAMNDSRLSLLRSLQGRHDAAVTLARSSSNALKGIPQKHVQAQSLQRLGAVLLAAGQANAAIAPLEQSISMYREAQTGVSPDHAEAITLLDRARAIHASSIAAR